MTRYSHRNLLSGAVGFLAGVGVMVAFIWRGDHFEESPTSEVEVGRAAIASMPQTVVSGNSGDVQPADTPDGQGYRLSLDRPGMRERLEIRDQRLIGMIMDMRRAGYEKLFSELGLGPADSAKLLERIELVYRAKIDARKHMTQLVYAQRDFDQFAKEALGEKYAAYRDYEVSDRARQETDRMTEFLQRSGLPELSADRLSQLQEAIRENSAYSARTLSSMSGPFDGLEQPRVGADTVAPHLELSQALFSVNSTTVLDRARELGFGSAEIAALQRYYESEMKGFDQTIQTAQNPLAGHLSVLEARLAALRSNPSTKPEDIASLERTIQSMHSHLRRAPSP